ncbi:phosphatidylglycerophosphatase A [Halorhodospira neutriphila]|uniref:phosphatidylglycerophosphatase A family protein n=1 Tax=Halorhodospira neutriphila TaxID=168379 RepID=UPI001906AA0E|nr:phosphatidylglycerophosphatase A [Halorhodospira neutriphila]
MTAAAWLATAGGATATPGLGALVTALLSLALAGLVLRCPPRGQAAIAAGLLLPAVGLCQLASGAFADKDDARIVADEVLTFPVAVAAQGAARHPAVLGGAYLASRALDGLKPPPARQAEGLPGGVGIVLDDLVTNLYTALLLAGGCAAYRRYRP